MVVAVAAVVVAAVVLHNSLFPIVAEVKQAVSTRTEGVVNIVAQVILNNHTVDNVEIDLKDLAEVVPHKSSSKFTTGRHIIANMK